MASKIFISYRRQDSASAAGRLYDFLELEVGRQALFKDVDNIPYGRDFRQEIRRAIDESQIVLVVIGRFFITEEKRLFQENDYVRYEIAYALAQGKTVIPVRVDEARMPTPRELPEEIRALSTINGPELRPGRWKDDCRDLLDKIKPLFGKTAPRSSSAPKAIETPANQFTDPRDGQIYKTVKLIGKTWMAGNLNFDVEEGCWFYKNDPKNGEKYGRLYTWEAAKKACPPGWRLPTDEEWKALAESVGGYYDYPTKKEIGDRHKGYQALLKGRSSGFAAQLGGGRDPDGDFHDLGFGGSYWSATERSAGLAWRYSFTSDYYGNLDRNSNDKSDGLSCRCVQD